MDLNKCKHWKSNKNINPFTKRKIKIGGPVYKKIEKICTINDNDNDNDNEKKCNEWILNKNINPDLFINFMKIYVIKKKYCHLYHH